MAEKNKKFAIPKRYDLKLKPDYPAGIFSGTVKISVSVVSETKLLVLDAVGLSVNPKSVSFASENKILEGVELFEKEEEVVLEFKESLPIGYGFLCMEFEGTLNPRIKGFLKCIFKNNGEKKNTVETESMPAGARWCFPCWDEPHCKEYKATLKITSEVVGWEDRGGEGWLAMVAILLVSFHGIGGPPGGYWLQKHLSDHPERMAQALMAYTRPLAYEQYWLFHCVALNAAMGALTVQLLSWGWGVRGRVRAQMVLLWICITALVLSSWVVSFDLRPAVSLPMWLGLVALGLYVIHKHGYVEEKLARVYHV